MGVWGEGEGGAIGEGQTAVKYKTHSRTSRPSSSYIPTHQKTISCPQTSQKAHTHSELFLVFIQEEPECMGMWVATPTVPRTPPPRPAQCRDS